MIKFNLQILFEAPVDEVGALRGRDDVRDVWVHRGQPSLREAIALVFFLQRGSLLEQNSKLCAFVSANKRNSVDFTHATCMVSTMATGWALAVF